MFKEEIQFNPVFYHYQKGEVNELIIACDYFLGNGSKYYNNKDYSKALENYILSRFLKNKKFEAEKFFRKEFTNQ